MDSTIAIPENITTLMNNPETLKKTGLGEHLRTARLAMHLSEKEAAARLHLNTNIIVMLENENYSAGPPAAFIRGYIRSYAKLVNLPEADIVTTLKELENATPARTIPIAIPPLQTKKYNERYFHWLTYVIVIVLVMLVSVWWSSHSRYVIADIPPAHPAAVNTAPATTPTTDIKPVTPLTIAVPAQATPAQTIPNVTPPTNTAQSAISQKAPEPTIAVTPNPQSPTIPAKSKPATKATTPAMGMVLPEPGADDEN